MWVTTPTNKGEYYVVDFTKDPDRFIALSMHYGFDEPYKCYGTKWLAYKNKEQAECKGEIVELKEPYMYGSDVVGFGVSYQEVVNKRNYYKLESEAERRLAELRGEK